MIDNIVAGSWKHYKNLRHHRAAGRKRRGGGEQTEHKLDVKDNIGGGEGQREGEDKKETRQITSDT